ncbi:MAG: NifU family protein [Chlamydiota bacterium]
MSLATLTHSHPWSRYSRKLSEGIMNPQCAGAFPSDEVREGLRMVSASEGHKEDGNAVKIFWLVDEADGQVVDARFQVHGCSALIGAAEGACQQAIGKNYFQAGRLTAELIEGYFQDAAETAFPEETSPYLNMVVDLLDNLAQQCDDIPVTTNYLMPPHEERGDDDEGGYPGWESLDKQHKMAVINEVLDREVRPYIELDGGGIDVIDLLDDKELVISYQGACVSCLYATGATLSHIQHVVSSKISADIVVVPKF